MHCIAICVFSVNPEESRKKSEDSGMSGESRLSFPEFPGFTYENLNLNAAQIHHGKLEILQILCL
jgi:hypothetical protein